MFESFTYVSALGPMTSQVVMQKSALRKQRRRSRGKNQRQSERSHGKIKPMTLYLVILPCTSDMGWRVVGRVHPSLDEPPKSTMFIRDGGGSAPKRKDSFADAVLQIAVALSPKVTSTRGDLTSGSPAKLIENCSKCYKQLSELNNLKLSGLLTEDEYDGECQAIMSVLKKSKYRQTDTTENATAIRACGAE